MSKPAAADRAEDDNSGGTYQWHLRSGGGRQQRVLLNTVVELFQPQQGSPPSEKDVQMREVADVLQPVEQHELDSVASMMRWW